MGGLPGPARSADLPLVLASGTTASAGPFLWAPGRRRGGLGVFGVVVRVAVSPPGGMAFRASCCGAQGCVCPEQVRVLQSGTACGV